MEIRSATIEDLGELERVERSCFSRERYPRSMLRSLLKEKEFRTYLAVDKDEVIGAASVMISNEPGRARLVSLATMPRHRNQGVARALLLTVERFVVEQGIDYISLEVGTGNLPALNLYLKDGFKIKGVIPNYYGRSRNAFYMEKVFSKSDR